jgi:PAS domain S-box-containing protein
MKREISYEEIEKDLAELNKALKTIKKKATVEKALNNIIKNVKFQATKLQKREAELKESNELNRLLVENLPVAIWMGDEEGKCCLVNKEFTRVLGWTKEELMGIKTPDAPFLCERGLPYMKEGTLEALRTIWNKTIERKKSATGEVPWLAKDGRVVIVKLVQIPYGKGESRLAAWVDVTEMRKRELELSKTLSALKDVVDKVVQKGELNTRIDVSKLSGKYKQIGGDINLMIDSLQSNIEELRQAIGSYSKVLNEVALGKLTARVDTTQLKGVYGLLGDTLNSIVTILEYDTKELKKKEAELIEALTLYGYTLEKIVDEGDLSIRIDMDKLTDKYKLIGADINYLVSNLQTKVEESKKREEKLKESEVFLQQILANMPDILVVTDNEGRWLQVSPSFEELTGFKIEEVLGKKTAEQPVYRDLPEGIELNKQMWERVYKGEVVQGLEIPWRTKEGKKIILSASERTLKDSKGKDIGRVFIARWLTK